MKKVLAAIAVMLMVLAFAPQASAYNTTKKCNTTGGIAIPGGGYNVTTCFQLDFQLQNDGTGVKINGGWIDVNTDCDHLEANPIKDIRFQTKDPNGDAAIIDYYNDAADMSDCHAYRSANGTRGPDNGSAWGYLQVTVAVDNHGDYRLEYKCKLKVDGTSSDCSVVYY